MATTTVTAASTATATSSANSSAADDFVNNFLSDLTPLLALFGDQATKQFLSLSTSWADNIMVAMGPLGILTIVVSAIRVSNLKGLKALIGRARESFASAEVEVLSSTSKDVSERYNGNEIIRKEAKTETMEFIYRQWTEEDYFPWDVQGSSTTRENENLAFGLKEACLNGVIKSTDDSLQRMPRSKMSSVFRRKKSKSEAEKDDEGHIGTDNAPLDPEVLEKLNQLDGTASNLTLHVPNAIVPAWQLWLFALFALAVQSVVLILSAISIYRWHTKKAGKIVNSYAYPCFLAGTIALSAGLIICAHTIDGSTERANFELANPFSAPKSYKIIRIQRSAENELNSWAISNSPDDRMLRTSRSHNAKYGAMTATGSFLAIAGYLAQYLGSRRLPWSSAIMQLVATILITAIRAYVRRGLANAPHAVECRPRNHELSWLAKEICNSMDLKAVSGSLVRVREVGGPPAQVNPECLESVLGASNKVHRDLDHHIFSFTPNPIIKGLILTHMRLQQLSTWKYPNEALLNQLISAMVAVTRILSDDAKKSAEAGRASQLVEESFHSDNLIRSVELDIPSILFCDCGKDTCDFKPQISTFKAQIHLRPDISVARHRLGALLDFWTQSEQHDAKDDIGNDKEHQSGISLEDAGFGEHHFRIIGSVVPDSQWTIRRLHILQNFIPQEAVYRIPPSDGIRLYLAKFSADAIPIENGGSSAVTYGLMFSSMLRNTSNRADPQANRYFEDSSNDYTDYPDLAVYTSNSLDRECAHDIFSAFMLAVAGRIIKLGGDYSKESLPWTLTHGMGRRNGARQIWKNTLIDQLATAVRTSGLARNTEEAYLLIVPSLAAHDLLPEVPATDDEDDEIPFFPPSSSSKRAGSGYPYGERIYNGYSLSSCGAMIRRWLDVVFGSERSEQVYDFLFTPDEGLSTSDQEITSVFEKTRAAMYLLRDVGTRNGEYPHKSAKVAKWFEEAMVSLQKAFERMGPLVPLLTVEELAQKYPTLIPDIKRIAKGE